MFRSRRRVLVLFVLLVAALAVFVSTRPDAPERTSGAALPVDVELGVPTGYERTVYGTVTAIGVGSMTVRDDFLVLVRPVEGAAPNVSFSQGGPEMVYSGFLPENVRCFDAEGAPGKVVDLAEVEVGSHVVVSWSRSGSPTLVGSVDSQVC